MTETLELMLKHPQLVLVPCLGSFILFDTEKNQPFSFGPMVITNRIFFSSSSREIIHNKTHE